MVEPVRTASAVEDGTGAPAESTRDACVGAGQRVVEPGTHCHRTMTKSLG